MSTTLPKTSDLLLEIKQNLEGNEPISIKEFLRLLNRRAFGILLFALAAPNLIPGLSFVFGILLFLPAIQLVFATKQVWLPKAISSRLVSRELLRNGIDKFVPYLVKIEKLFKPRLTFLCEGIYLVIWGIQIALMAFILIFPIPLGNIAPALAIVVFAVGLLQKDGLLIILANLIFIISLMFTYLGLGAALAAIKWIFASVLAFF